MTNLPPPNWDDLPPPDLDFSMPDDPFPDDLFAGDTFAYLPDDDPFTPFSAPLADVDAPAAPAHPHETDAGWGWHDAAIIAVGRVLDDGATEQYSIGAVELYANTHTGDLGGSYLEIGTFDDMDEAAAYYHELQGDIHRRGLLPFELVDYASEQAAARAAQRGDPAPTWGAAGAVEYAAYEEMQSLDEPLAPDLPPAANDVTIASADDTTPAFRALSAIGIAADGFDPETDPPPFIDPDTGTAYWIGVFQPDKGDPDNCVTSILSLGRDPTTGEVEAQLAPCVPGAWDKTYAAAEYLLGVIEEGGIERAFDVAEGMALATDQRELWEQERGLPLEPDAARDLAAYTRAEWELDV